MNIDQDLEIFWNTTSQGGRLNRFLKSIGYDTSMFDDAKRTYCDVYDKAYLTCQKTLKALDSEAYVPAMMAQETYHQTIDAANAIYADEIRKVVSWAKVQEFIEKKD